MNKLNYRNCTFLIVALACIAFWGCQTSTTAPSSGAATAMTGKNAGRLVIHRAPNLAEALVLSLDGVKQPPLRTGDTFNSPLSTGPHVLTAVLEPNQLNLAPVVKNLTVQPGQVYTFNAIWEADTLVLR